MKEEDAKTFHKFAKGKILMWNIITRAENDVAQAIFEWGKGKTEIISILRSVDNEWHVFVLYIF